MKILKLIIITLLIVVLLSGCWDQNIFERIGFVLSMGIDMGSMDGTSKYTIAYPIISETRMGLNTTDGNSSIKNVDVLTVESHLIREARDMLRLSSSKQIEGGKVQNVIFSSELAREREISEYLEIYERDTQSTVQATVIIVDGSAKELIEKGAAFKGKPRFSIYLAELIKRNNKEGYCPEINIVRYNILNVKPGISPIVPLIKLRENEVQVIGSALIDRDKMAGQIDTRETSCLFLAMGEPKSSEITFKLPDDTDTQKKIGIIYTRRVKSRKSIHFEENRPVVDFDIKVNATLDEYSWGNITDQEFERQMEQCVESSLNETLNTIARKLKEAQCDVFGIGDHMRAYYHDYWKAIGELEGWKPVYSEIPMHFNVHVDIVRYGEIR